MLSAALLALALTGQSVRFVGIDVSGVQSVRPGLVATVMRLERGQVYSRNELTQRLAELNGTGLFETMALVMIPVAGDSGAARVRVEVKEFGMVVPPAGMARFLDPVVIVRKMAMDIDPVPIDIEPRDYLEPWGIRTLPRAPWPPSVARASAARRLAWVFRRPITPRSLLAAANALRDGIRSRDRSLTQALILDAVSRLDSACAALDAASLARRDVPLLACYAMLRTEVLIAVDPGFLDAASAQPRVFGGPGLALLERRAMLDPGDSAITVALAVAPVLRASILRRAAFDYLGLGFFQRATIPSGDRALFESVLGDQPTVRHVLRSFPLFRRARCLAAAWLGETSVIASEMAEPIGWSDPATPGFLLIYSRAVHNNSKSAFRLPGFTAEDCLVVGAEDIDWLSRRGGPRPAGAPAEAIAHVLAEAPRAHDIDTWLARGNGGFYDGYTRGRMALRLLRPRQAVAAFTAALAQREDPRARYLRAIAHLAVGNVAAAESDLEVIREERVTSLKRR